SIRAAEEELGSDGRILVRASGTEPLIRVMGEGKEINQLERIIDDIASVVEHELGVENN
ncbi:MAG: phosphoglucosamine mutase, partial [Dialister sp.]|nr:phosphoglucosamine mutase [Dialister sp.]MDY6115233.1 phosphoglucosamine mutase [Dialister sp.]